MTRSGDTSMATSEELLDLKHLIKNLPRDSFVDSSGCYRLLFMEFEGTRLDFGTHSHNYFGIIKEDSLIEATSFYKDKGKEFRNITKSFSFNSAYLIVVDCSWYIGNSSSFGKTIFYFRKY